MKNTLQENLDIESLLQEIAKRFNCVNLSDLREITLAQVYLRFNTVQEIQRYNLQTWSKALSYISGRNLLFQDHQSLLSFLNGSMSPDAFLI